MNRIKILGLAIGASLLLGFEPSAEATPMAAPASVVELSAFSGNVTQVLLGIQRRHERRVERRVHRHERRAERRVHRQERRNIRHGH
jgi:hypothetical protein